MEKPQGSLFKVGNTLNDNKSVIRRGAGLITPGENNNGQDSGIDNEYNYVGAPSSKGGADNDSLDQ